MPRPALLLSAGAALLAGAGAVVLALPHGSASAQQPASDCPKAPVRQIRDGFPEPKVLRSHDGRLSLTLHAGPAKAFISRPGVRSNLWNGQYPAPTIRVCPGDTLRVKLVNDLKQPTNLHLHGMHVSPKGHSDNILVSIPPGGSRQYEYHIPRDQTPGMYWYHPHRHMFTDQQVFSGMAGMLIVEGSSFDDLPGIAGVPERTIAIQEDQIAHGAVVSPDKATDKGIRMLVNGHLRPTIPIAPGQIQRWRIVNASADRFVRLRIPGQKLYVLAEDGNPLRAASPHTQLLISPGARREVLVRGTTRSTRLETLAFRQPFENTRRQVLADVVAQGAPVQGRTMPDLLEPRPDLRTAHIDRRRVIHFESDFPRFLIDHKTFDPHRVDQTMKLGSTEEWEIRNDSGEWHVFHIHVNPFQVVKVNGRPVDHVDYEDDVPISPRGSVTLRMRFTDFTGRFVIHCHLLSHEDGGMMSLVQVVP